MREQKAGGSAPPPRGSPAGVCPEGGLRLPGPEVARLAFLDGESH